MRLSSHTQDKVCKNLHVATGASDEDICTHSGDLGKVENDSCRSFAKDGYSVGPLYDRRKNKKLEMDLLLGVCELDSSREVIMFGSELAQSTGS